MLPVVLRTEAGHEIRRLPFARRTPIRSGAQSSSDSSLHTWTSISLEPDDQQTGQCRFERGWSS
jgi:hypothetical protein